jgi:hypothetical protein
MKLLIMQCFPTVSHFIPLLFKHRLQYLDLKTPSVYISLLSETKFLHPYRVTGKITVLYILIFAFLGSRREDKMFWTEW